jgi:threonine dehydrogenase-like Zn-dependent dehydrogenase
VVLIGLPPHGDTAAVPVDDLTIRGGFGYTSSAWRDVVALLNAGRLRMDFLVTHRFGLADWQQALDALRGPQSPRGKVMLTIGSPEVPPEVRS